MDSLKIHAQSIPLDPPSVTRFGNSAFKKFISVAKEEIYPYLVNLKKYDFEDEEIEEFSIYLLESLGNPIRIDYGTGHELMFICALVILWKKIHSENTGENEKTDLDSIPIIIARFDNYQLG